MDRIIQILNSDFCAGTISGFRKGFSPEARKITLRPFTTTNGERLIQFTYLLADRATHENLSASGGGARILELLRDLGYAQALLICDTAQHHLTHYGKLKVRRNAAGVSGANTACGASAASAAGVSGANTACHPAAPHDRKKDYGIDLSASYLEALGLVRGGSIVPAMKDKLIQISKFITLATALLPPSHAISAVDFGCGKAYLTFALHHHLTAQGRRPTIYGIDLKADVLADCTAIAERLGCHGLTFIEGDIKSHGSIVKNPDLVVALHACDTATDLAIDAALATDARAIVLAPCCQHELFSRLHSDTLAPMLRGAMRERTAALVTDALRVLRLETAGYKVDCVDFVSDQHTPKNLMIRAKKVRGHDKTAAAREQAFREMWGV